MVMVDPSIEIPHDDSHCFACEENKIQLWFSFFSYRFVGDYVYIHVLTNDVILTLSAKKKKILIISVIQVNAGESHAGLKCFLWRDTKQIPETLRCATEW